MSECHRGFSLQAEPLLDTRLPLVKVFLIQCASGITNMTRARRQRAIVYCQRLFLIATLTGWVAMVLACGGIGERTGASARKTDAETEFGTTPRADSEARKPGGTNAWSGKFGTGSTAYDALPEPWRAQLLEEWNLQNEAQKKAVEAAETSF
jgi:hypothetical protein